jgi:putative transcriptional regulator
VVRSICLLLLFGLASPTFGDDAQPMKSILLVARKNLPDPFFRDSVVLVTRSGGPAPVGVIVNHPTDVPLSRVFSDIERLRSRDETLFFGGPVLPEQLLVVFRAAVPPAAAIEVLEGVYMSLSRDLLRELLGRETPVEGLRVFAGHAGWAPGQLESEVARGDWHLVAADARMVLEMEPANLWKELERRASATTVRYEHPPFLGRHDADHSVGQQADEWRGGSPWH